jgi:hypothetical protein
MATSTARPQFNHVGLTVPREALAPENRSAIVSFFQDVFGWQERPVKSKSRSSDSLLVLMVGGIDQFVALFAHDEPTKANPPDDHFGMRVESLDQLQEYLRRAKTFAAEDVRIEVSDYETNDYDDVVKYRLHSFFVRFFIPLAFEVQYYEMFDDEPVSA